MQTWEKLALAAGALVICLLLIVTVLVMSYLKRRSGQSERQRPQRQDQVTFSYVRNVSGMKGVDLAAMEGLQMAAKWRNMYPIKLFDWPDYPALLADAVDRGWAAFAFTYSCSSHCPVSSAGAFVLCTKCCLGEGYQPEIAWEIGPGADFMQLIRLNPRLVQSAGNSGSEESNQLQPSLLVQALQSALPLPGPFFAEAGSFPREGYFEITIVAVGTEDRTILTSDISTPMDNDNVKLILRPSPSEKYPLAANGFNGFYRHELSTKKIVQARIQQASERKVVNGHAPEDKTRILSIGLSPGVAPPFRMPGADQGSIGLHSNGHIFLNGVLKERVEGDARKHRRGGWAGVTNTTVGCGYSPVSGQVFFTLNGELVAEVSCSEYKEFGHPLHATVASNYDVTLLVNFGQCSFEFMPANDHRVADPSSSSLHNNSVKSQYSSHLRDESGELFSMRRLDSHWWSGRRTWSLSQPEADGDLFEISLDGKL